MNENSRPPPISLSISAVERDTGLSKDTLRVWERRYGFPMPGRDGVGERAYTLAQVEKLRLVKRLLDAGHRPGRIVPLDVQALQHLAEQTVDQPQRPADSLLVAADLRDLLAFIRSHDMVALRSELTRLAARCGVSRFVIEVLGPLNSAVGDAWVRGQLEIFEEHAYTEMVQTVLRQTIGGFPAADASAGPRVLLTTFPQEPHGLGLLMAEALLLLEGCHCVSLGVQTPVWDIARAAQAFRTDIVALSFTGCMNPNQVVEGLSELVSKLPDGTTVWAGGAAPVLHRRRVPGVRPLASFEALGAELQRWRAETPERAARAAAGWR